MFSYRIPTLSRAKPPTQPQPTAGVFPLTFHRRERSLIISSISLEGLPRLRVLLHSYYTGAPSLQRAPPNRIVHPGRRNVPCKTHTACTPSYKGNLRHASAQSISPSTSSVTTLITSSIGPMSCIIVSRSLNFLNNQSAFYVQAHQMNHPIRGQVTHRSVMVSFCNADEE